ncbi:MAG: SNF2-related protein, partial [Bacteroidota bacterium]
MQANRQKASIVFNLHPHQLLGLLPEAFIVSHKKDGSLGYILQRASLETIGSYQLECTAVCKKLIAALDTWQEQTLEDKFNAKKGRRKKLAQLWEDKKIKKQIRSYLDKHLHAFYQEVRTYQPLLTKGLERRAYVPDFLVRIVKETLEPHLYFQRSSEHMRYIFSVWRKGRKIRIPQGRVHTLVNEPAWVIWDDHLVQIAHINGLMVRPFWNKQEVIVPTRSMKRYFEQFVVKVAAKVDLEVKGFEVKKYSSIQKAVLRVADNFLSRELQIQLQFYYDSATFGWNDKQAQHTRLVFGTDESIVIHRVVRDQVQEQTYVQKLLELGLTTNNTAFQLEVVDDDAHELLAWFIQHQQELVDLGFELTAPQIQQKAIQLVAGELTANISKGNDWFDLDGRVQIGETSVSFHLLFPYIRANDSFYPLADGTYFLIPKAWMNRYKLLAERGKRQGTKMRFPRSLQHMLKDFSEIEKTADTPDEVLAAVAGYKPSKHLKASLRPYQLAGVKWLVRHYYNGFGACLADDMGLGKTLQTISVLLHAKENLPKRKQAPQPKQLGLFENTVVGDYYDALQALVILPASLVFNWRQELKKFAPHLQVLNYTGAKRKVHQKLLHRFDLILTTYQTARQD